MRIKPAFLVIIFFLSLIPLSADSFADNSYWAFNGGILFFGADSGKKGYDPTPIIPYGGASFAWQFWSQLRLEISGDLYFTNYEYNTMLGYPVASSLDNRSAFVLGFVTAVQLTGHIPIGENGTAVRVFGGPAMDIRIVSIAAGLNYPAYFTGDIETDPKMQTEAIAKYFWEEGRWFLPVIGTGMDFPINEKFFLGFDFRVWIPLYRLSVDKDIPAANGWRFGVGFRITPRKNT